ncbi:hypothetical protein AAVH_13337 [Aphelenchoides avenae]|nr:hypothetical protein AAVH_13337 [Aphelenchus avenae]
MQCPLEELFQKFVGLSSIFVTPACDNFDLLVLGHPALRNLCQLRLGVRSVDYGLRVMSPAEEECLINLATAQNKAQARPRDFFIYGYDFSQLLIARTIQAVRNATDQLTVEFNSSHALRLENHEFEVRQIEEAVRMRSKLCSLVIFRGEDECHGYRSFAITNDMNRETLDR